MIVISSALGFTNTTVTFKEVAFPTNLENATSYVNHPATKAILESLGATTVPGRWSGPEVGEQYLAVPLATNPRTEGVTKDTAVSDVSELKAILCTRIA